VVTSDLGFSYGEGENNNDNWPGSTLPDGCDAPDGQGDDGEFQDIQAGSVTLIDNAIPCDESAAQCPDGWMCEGIDGDGIGGCQTDGSTSLGCGSLGNQWADGDALPEEAACLAVQGTDGCGFEQQLSSVVRGLSRTDQSDFLRDNAGLIVLVVSDEEDCSMEDGPGLFATDEVQNQEDMMINLVCGNNPEYLYPAAHFYDALVGFKDPGAVFFAAIVGVPYEGGEAAACQGAGNEIDDCLDQDGMQLVAEQPNLPDDEAWYFRPACERIAGEETVTKAFPGRRYVELAAAHFGDRGYVDSICNEDWMPAIEAIREFAAAW
jgi:hypothetical protein